jgi:aspartate/methionine/tyrosine aminotransferase
MNTPAPSRLCANLEPSEIREIGHLADERPGTLKLQFGESSRPTPEFIRAAGAKALADGFTFYTPNAGYLDLREAIAGKVAELHGASYSPAEEIIVTAGGVMALYLAVHALVDPGDEVVVVSPVWPNIRAIISLAGAVPVEVPLVPRQTGYELDTGRIEAAITGRTRAIFMNSPGNPTGWVATPQQQARVRDAVLTNRLALISDEVYDRLLFDAGTAPSPSMARFTELRERLVVVNSFSKAYSMTGWRVGYALGPAAFVRVMAGLQEFVVSHAPSVSQRAALAALADGEPFVEESRRRYRALRDLACGELAGQPGIDFVAPRGAFYLFVKVKGMRDPLAFARELATRHGVALAPGSAFGAGGEGAVRICFAVDEPVLREALCRFRRAVTDLADSQKGCCVPGVRGDCGR